VARKTGPNGAACIPHRDCATSIVVGDADHDLVDSIPGAQTAAKMASNSGSSIKMFPCLLRIMRN
jgi:hypothetical protein